MISTLTFCILLVVTKVIAFPQLNALHGCNGHLSDSIVEENGYYYKCNNGMLDPMGCISNATRVQIGGTFRLFNFEMRCVLSSTGFMTKEYVGCIVNGKTVLAGDTVEIGKVWYKCQSEKFFVEQIAGCVHDNKHLSKGDKAQSDLASFECRDTDNGPSMVQIGCMAKGIEYRIGEAYSDDSAVYSCSTELNLIKRKVIGCVHNGKRLLDKDSYYDGDFIMMCIINEKGARFVATGCIHHQNNGTEIGKNVGCVWIDGPYPKSFTTVCRKSDKGIVYKERMNCLYEPRDVIEPGCYRTIDGVVIGCRRTADSMEYVTLDSSKLDKASNYGLSHC